MATNLDDVKKIVLVLSGKGGVGKSTTAVNLALSLAEKGKKIGLLDLDICGPSIALMLGFEETSILRNEKGWTPLKTKGSNPISVISIAFLLQSKDTAIIWRGPKKASMIQQFLYEVDWGQLDFLLIDTPPGTSDEHISLVELLKERIDSAGAILVTTPQIVAVNDVRREITFCHKANLPMIGLIENMSYFRCPDCSHCMNVFSSGGGENLAKFANINFLGGVSIDPSLAESMESGKNYIKEFQDSEAAKSFLQIADKLLE
ncbi:cytosolic Fe-S cluster assembly factor NUBP2-like [Brevipalpus obovatus]|uniref:cytosolic Fe-S cluster assembly factor NUBP2-like n=1 Tax=Brevipalpus obovatus TaxID=246614 RepID=UPI003D9DECA4